MITVIVTFFKIVKEVFKTIYKVTLLIVIAGALTTGLDYTRVSSGDKPMFNVKFYNNKTKKQTFQGVFYKATRKVRNDPNEPLTESSNIKFKLLNKYDVKVPTEYKNTTIDYAIETKEVENCQEQSKLYYANENIKVYTYCIESFQVTADNKKEELISALKENPDLIDEIDSKMGFTGIHYNGTTQMYMSRDDEYTNNGLAMFKCNNNGITDIYLGPRNMQMQPDFCTYKNDDFKFIYKVEELEHQKVEQVETFWEDQENYYQFSETKSDFVIIKVPAIRGRQEQTIQLKYALYNGIVTIDELKEKGLEFNTVSKTANTTNETTNNTTQESNS